MSSFFTAFFVALANKALDILPPAARASLREKLDRLLVMGSNQPNVRIKTPIGSGPKFLVVLKGFFDREEWRNLWDVSDADADKIELLPPHQKARALNWWGVANLRLGHWQEADVLFARAYDLCPLNEGELQAAILSNQSILDVRRRNFSVAQERIGKVLELDAHSEFGLQNALTIASLRGDDMACEGFSATLVRIYPKMSEYDSPLFTDPDLEIWRSMPSFHKLFPKGRPVAPGVVGALVSTAALAAIPTLLGAAFYYMTCNATGLPTGLLGKVISALAMATAG